MQNYPLKTLPADKLVKGVPPQITEGHRETLIWSNYYLCAVCVLGLVGFFTMASKVTTVINQKADIHKDQVVSLNG